MAWWFGLQSFMLKINIERDATGNRHRYVQVGENGQWLT